MMSCEKMLCSFFLILSKHVASHVYSLGDHLELVIEPSVHTIKTFGNQNILCKGINFFIIQMKLKTLLQLNGSTLTCTEAR